MKKIWLVVGTRPELIKLAPVAHMLSKRNIPYEILNTAQHKDLLDPYWAVFGLKANYSLDFMQNGQSLSELTARGIQQLDAFLKTRKDEIKCMIAQGDTTTVMCTSMVSFYHQIPFMHVEAGLRSFDFQNPFPEEYNRRVASIWCEKHFSPTAHAKSNLLAEGISGSLIHVTGNTVIDALQWIVKSDGFKNGSYESAHLQKISGKKNLVMITCHRRENHGENLQVIINAIATLAKENKDHFFVWLTHPNPAVKQALENSTINKLENVILHNPINYLDLIRLMSECRIAITDSGGIQEEAPSFGVPVIILREVTERPEAVEAGLSVLAGAHHDKIIDGFRWACQFQSENIQNPYGDGHAAEKIVNLIS